MCVCANEHATPNRKENQDDDQPQTERTQPAHEPTPPRLATTCVITKTTRRASGGGTWVMRDDRRPPLRRPGLSRARRMPRLRIGRQPHLEALAAIPGRHKRRSSTSTGAGTSARRRRPPRRSSISWPPAWPNTSTTNNPQHGAPPCKTTTSPSEPPNTQTPTRPSSTWTVSGDDHAILVGGKYLTAKQAEAERIAVAGVEFAYLDRPPRQDHDHPGQRPV